MVLPARYNDHHMESCLRGVIFRAIVIPAFPRLHEGRRGDRQGAGQ